MDTLSIEGKIFVKASKAARDLGYTSDYVGQLCRNGSLESHLVGRSWYVNPIQLKEHKTEKKRMSRIKAREQVKKSIAEFQQKKNQLSFTASKHGPITYAPDTHDLIPSVTNKTKIQSDKSKESNISRENKNRAYINKPTVESTVTVHSESNAPKKIPVAIEKTKVPNLVNSYPFPSSTPADTQNMGTYDVLKGPSDIKIFAYNTKTVLQSDLITHTVLIDHTPQHSLLKPYLEDNSSIASHTRVKSPAHARLMEIRPILILVLFCSIAFFVFAVTLQTKWVYISEGPQLTTSYAFNFNYISTILNLFRGIYR